MGEYIICLSTKVARGELRLVLYVKYHPPYICLGLDRTAIG